MSTGTTDACVECVGIERPVESRVQMSTPTQHVDLAVEPQELGAASFRLVLKNRHFLLLWFAQLISQIVLNAANFGVILLVDEVTHSVFMAGLAITAFTLPAVPFSAIAGVVEIGRASCRER